MNTDWSGRQEPTDGRGEGPVVDGVELVRPGVAVLRLGPGDAVPSLPLRVAVPGTGAEDGSRRTVQVTEVIEAQGDEPVVALVLAEPVSASSGTSTLAGVSTLAATDQVQANWICKLFPKLCS